MRPSGDVVELGHDSTSKVAQLRNAPGNERIQDRLAPCRGKPSASNVPSKSKNIGVDRNAAASKASAATDYLIELSGRENALAA